MRRTTIRVNKIDALSWPERCPHCGRDLEEGNATVFDLKIRRGLKGMLTGGLAPKHVPVKLCGPCAKKISKFRTVEVIGGLAIFIAIAPFFFQRFIKVESMEVKYLMGAALWLGVILMGIAEVAIKQLVGTECRELSVNRWALKFRNEMFSNEFLNLNSKYVERG